MLLIVAQKRGGVGRCVPSI